jgi:uncharacterized protein (TIGR02594 family)
VLSPDEMRRVGIIGRELAAVERAGRTGAAADGVLPSNAQSAIRFVLGTIGARVGAQAGAGTSGASLRSEAPPPAPPVDAKSPYQLASYFTGLDERKDAAVLSGFIRSMTGKNLDPTKTAWCAAFVNAVLGASGHEGTGALNARSFLDFGTETKNPQRGDVAVFWRESPDSWKGHVGFYAGETTKNGQRYIRVLGGNQDDSVSEKLYPASRLLSVRRPPVIRT